MPLSFRFPCLAWIHDGIEVTKPTVAAAVYTTVLQNTVSKWMVRLVPPAAIAAGLPSSNVTALLSVAGTPALATTYSPAIVAAVGGATQKAYEHGVQ